MRDVQNRNTMLEEIKQKSTTTILVKYNKSIELTEQLTL